MRKIAPLTCVKAGPDDGMPEGVFTGYASIFGNIDSYGDMVQPGAFTQTLADWAASGNTIPVLWGHDQGDPFSNIGGVLEAVEDDRGLRITATLDLGDPKAAKVYRLLKGRRVSQMSFAYDVVEGHEAHSAELGEYYSLDVLKLYEVSVVPIGANQQAEILAVKHLAAAVKAGRAPADGEAVLREARAIIDSVLAHSRDDNQGKASEPGPAKPAVDEEPARAKSAMGEEPARASSVKALAAQFTIYALAYGQKG